MRLIAADALLANREKRSLTDAAVVFKQNITALADSGFDVVLIDTALALGVSLASAPYAADCVVSPIELEAYSIQGIKKMLTTIAIIRKLNTKLKFLDKVASKVDVRNPSLVRHPDELKAACPQLMIPGGIGLKSSIADALAAGVPVWKIKKIRSPQGHPGSQSASWLPMFMKRWSLHNDYHYQENDGEGHEAVALRAWLERHRRPFGPP